MSHFIQNTGDSNLSNIINNLLPSKTAAMDFLVGYFYFSGIQEIYKNLEDKPMRILVGLDMDHELLNKTSEFDFFAQKRRPSSNKDIREGFYKSLVNLFNQSNYFESDEQAEAFRIYYEKIKAGTLEIRKTLDPCHAKMYIFAYKEAFTEDGETPGTVITGSSNFTFSGLRGNNEINVRFHTKDEYNDAEEIFEGLWTTATPIVDQNNIQDFEERVIKRIWFEKVPSPYLLYLRVLWEYFNLDESKHILTPAEITHDDFSNLKYQEDAIRIAIDTINRHNGCIVADVVGLGKSVIGSAIARNLNLRTFVIAPPHLVPQWEDYSFQFNFNARVYSRGNLPKVLDEYYSHHRDGESMLIIIDEAHSYRNEYIEDYAILHQICQNNKVLLLSATPFNNRPDDIYAMIKLFQVPTRSTLQTVENLGAQFNYLIGRYKAMRRDQRRGRYDDAGLKNAVSSIGQEIRKIISPLVIRRSRIDLEKIPAYKNDLKKQGYAFPIVEPPTLKSYRLRDLKDLYINTLEVIYPKNIVNDQDYSDDDDDRVEDRIESPNTFQAARYKCAIYVLPEHADDVKKVVEEAGIDYNLFTGRQRSLAGFMRTLLVRRFESSQHAFRMSLDLMLRSYENIKNWIEIRQTVPVFKKGQLPNIQDLYDSVDDTIIGDGDVDAGVEEAIEHLKSKGMFEIKTEYLSPEFIADIENDIQVLQDLKNKWDKVDEDDDPKFEGFVDLLSDQLARDPERKIVVFSQFADTIDFLGEKLKKAGLPVLAYTSKQASKKAKEEIRLNFDAGVKKKQQKDDYQILVATDAISEGYNLHRAGCIYNYDIPYNPTRVIQRVGRINRINKKVFERLYIYNYFPTEIGESETGIMEITTLKMAMIHAIMGEDTKYLTMDEELNNYFADQYQQLMQATEEESWDTPYRVLLEELHDSPEMQEALDLPLRSKVRRLSTTTPSGVIAFARKNGDLVFKMALEDGIVTLGPKEALEIVKAEVDEKGYPLSDTFSSLFEQAKHALFVLDTEADKDKTKRDAIDKIRVIRRSGKVTDTEYLDELTRAIELDAIAGFSLREINRLRSKEYERLPEVVTREYVTSVLHNYDNIASGVETLILAEEITNIGEDTTNNETTTES